jgi:hypothetical protein
MDATRALQALREIRPGSADRVLVAVMNNPRDLAIARQEGWYRIPVKRAPKRIGADYLAFYLTGQFPEELRHRVPFYAPIFAYRLVTRVELLPGEADHPRAGDTYFKIEIGRLVDLARPVISERLRRITFISTTLETLLSAREIRELWDPSSYQDELEAAFRYQE